MDYPTASTIWSEPPDGVKNVINLFFTLADSKENDAGDRLAKEVFTPDGEFLLAQGTFKGTSEIRESRKDAWTTIKTRRHTVQKVYANNAGGLDLVLIGTLAATTAKGDQTRSQFVARLLIEQEGTAAKIRQYRVIVPASQDGSPILGAQSAL